MTPLPEKLGSAGDGAVGGMKALARKMRDEQWGEAAVVGVALMPVAAVVGAISETSRELSPEDLTKTNKVLDASLRAAADPKEFRNLFLEVASTRTGINFVKSDQPVPSSRDDHDRQHPESASDWILDLVVEKMHLQRSAGGDKYSLVISARARLLGATDATVAYDQPVEFRSEAALSVDWTANDGEPLHRVAHYGYRMIAEQIISRIFPGR